MTGHIQEDYNILFQTFKVVCKNALKMSVEALLTNNTVTLPLILKLLPGDWRDGSVAKGNNCSPGVPNSIPSVHAMVSYSCL